MIRGKSIPRNKPRGDLVVVREYSYRHEAEIGRSMLEANGVEAIIFSDDSGGEYPSLGASNRVRLLVRQRDAERARHLLG